MFPPLVLRETGVVRAVLVVGLVFGFVSAALADGRPSGGPKADWSFTVGGGGLYTPDYEGSDDYRFRALPYFQIAYQDWVTLSVPEGLKVAAINDGAFKAGAIAGYRFDRDAGDDVALRGWGDVDGVLEVGAFAEYKIEAIKLSLEARQGISGDDPGLIATLGLRYETRVAGTVISIGPKISWVDDDYAQTYFGITPAQAAASFVGYAPYVAEGGIKDYGVGLTAVLPLDDAWSLTGIVSVSRLAGDAADSPIVAAQGSETQVTLGLFAGYRF